MTVFFDKGIWLDLSPKEQDQLWQQCEAECPDPVSRWQTYINQLCLQGVLPWLQEEFRTQLPINVEHLHHDCNGIALTMRTMRLILIPSEDIDQSELRVPQIWVDELSQVGDYYLAVQVNPDEGQLHIWGYTDYGTLAQNGAYEPGDRSYSLDQDDLITDLTILTVAHQLGMTSAIDRSDPSRIADTPLISHPPVAQSGEPSMESRSVQEATQEATQKVIQEVAQTIAAIDISQWLTPERSETWVTKGWQLLDDLLPAVPDMALAFRWNAAEDENGGESRGKRLDFSGAEGTVCLMLLVRVTPEDDGRFGIRVQIRPETFDSPLPEGVRLVLVSPTEEIVQSVQSRSLDSYIQLKRFRVPPQTDFSIQVKWGNTVMTEAFSTGSA